jgi:hypothetical protein
MSNSNDELKKKLDEEVKKAAAKNIEATKTKIAQQHAAAQHPEKKPYTPIVPPSKYNPEDEAMAKNTTGIVSSRLREIQMQKDQETARRLLAEDEAAARALQGAGAASSSNSNVTNVSDDEALARRLALELSDEEYARKLSENLDSNNNNNSEDDAAMARRLAKEEFQAAQRDRSPKRK